MRRSLTVLALLAVTGCSDGAGPRPLAARSAAPVDPSPAATSPAATSPAATPVDTALPTCLGPEVRPEWWTYYCADAGYQLDLTWDSWTAREARAHGTATVTKGEHRGWSGPVRVVFDRPRQAADGRWLYARGVVTYDRRGPAGEPAETFDVWQLWEDHLNDLTWSGGDPSP